MSNPYYTPDSIVRISAVIARTGLPRSTIYSRMKSGTFPAHVPLGERSRGWISSDIDHWIRELKRTKKD